MTTPATPAAHCGCAAQPDDRRAVAVDPDIKHAVLTRLRRIEGQVRGVQKMVEDERYCAYIINQISSVQEALRGASRELLRNHLKHCASTTIRAATRQRWRRRTTELLDLMSRSSRG
jgi:DNA-binding FrmR family transcriptional regulator